MKQAVVGLVSILVFGACASAPRSHDTVPSTPTTISVAWSVDMAFERLPGILEEVGWQVTSTDERTGVIQGARSRDGYPEWVGVTLIANTAGGTDLRISVRSSRGGFSGSQLARELREQILERTGG